jgi:uncharacterized metal-binding protein YceD (DUF177 family)
MVNDSVVVPEFSRPIPIDQIGGRETVREIEATPAECAALAERLDLIALDGLAATLRLRRLPGGLIRVSGRFAAEVVQSCVVTLVPVPAHCAATFSMRFGEIAMPETLREIEVEAEGEDEPEPVEGGEIDLGEAVVQQLAVSLEPYPRAPGAMLPEAPPDAEEEAGAAGVNPFAVLAKLTDDPGDNR